VATFLFLRAGFPCAPTSKTRSTTSSAPWICSGGIFDWDRALLRLDELNAKAEDPNLWDRPADAQKVMRERTQLETAIGGTRKLERDLDDAVTLAELADEEGDETAVEEARRLVA